MNYQTLYRKYRPKSFELVFGQEAIIKTLKNIIKTNKLSHAYLFTGPRGTGKTSSAKLLAKAINCLNNKDGDACNECENCKSFNDNSNPDIIEIDAASNNGVDEIREIKNNINLVPSMSKYKIYIIDEVHMLSIGAFNALLKTLEEPPEYIIFILATTEPQKLPATIISRCQRFDFKSISNNQMFKCLENIINKEKIVIEEAAINEIIVNSNGGLRDAIGLLDQSVVYTNNNIKKSDVEELSGNVSNEDLINLLNNIKQNNFEKIFGISSKWESSGKDFDLIIKKITSLLSKNIINRKVPNYYTGEHLKKLNSLFQENKMYILFNEINGIQEKIKYAYNKKMIFDIEMINIINKLNSNVSRETLEETNEKMEIQEEINVPRETLNKELEKAIEKLKNIRINNILKDASKSELIKIKNKWNDLDEFLIDENFKFEAGFLLKSNVAAASETGIIIISLNDAEIKRIELKYDNCKKMINDLFQKKYKLVFLSEEYWKTIRTEYVEKVKNKMLKEISEKDIIDSIKKIKESSSINDFNDLIEMEEI